jgi:hypothetical protein
MLAPTIFPEWLPPVVAEEAEELAQDRPEDEELLRRLATDPRMESVWREIKKHNSSEPIDWERWSKKRKPKVLSNEDIALKLTFRYAFFIALGSPIIPTAFSSRQHPRAGRPTPR